MDSDFGISKALKKLSSSKVQEVVKYLKDDLGVEDIKDLKKVYEKDLTNDKLLKPIQARNLIEYWEQETLSNVPEERGIQKNTKKNVGRGSKRGTKKKRKSSKQYKKKKKSSSSDSDTTSSDDSSSSESEPGAVNVKIGGNSSIEANSAVIGKGNATTTEYNNGGSERKTKRSRKQSKKQQRSSSSDSDTTCDDDSSSSGSDAGEVNVKIGGKSRIDAQSAVFGKGDATTTEYNNGGKNVYNVRGDVKGDGAFAGSNKTKNYGIINKNIS